MVRIDDELSAIKVLVISLHPKNDGKYFFIDVCILVFCLCQSSGSIHYGRSVPSSIRCASTAPSPTGEASHVHVRINSLRPS